MDKTLKRFEQAMEQRLTPLKANSVACLWQRLSGLSTRQLWWLARPLARVVQLCNPRERRVTRQNLGQAFPQLDSQARARLASDSLAHSTATMLELGKVWLGDEDAVRDSILEVHGRNLLDEARAEGRGVIVLAPHFGNWEVLNFWLSSHFPFTAMYEPPKFERLDPIIRNGRERMGASLVPTNSRGVAALLKALKRAEAIGILPDQEPGRGSGVFADFYGRPAYTATLLPKLVARTDARVVTGVAQRLEDGHGFAIHFLAADEGVYCEEEVASARGVNASVEAAIALAPAQYQWEYKRWRKSPQEMEQQPGWQKARFYARTYSFFSLKGWRRYFKHRRKASKRG
ncbi:lysophospholipid acyltransferase family protein [Cobetia sp. 4B]|uniref:lysophospholipid acyltransferase family protein n=1 Tax=Cobetia sp. 4B TaxID=2758724 RepID=UPI001F0B342A|nr:lysophospholipid acyltransferase family protein [Cobetia sp. 4B]